MKYLSIAQTAERWGISTRRIQILCGEGRVPGAIRIGTNGDTELFKKSRNINGFRACRIANNLY